MNKLKLGWLYPDLFNLHGERGSVQALVRAGENLGIEVEVLRVSDPEDDIPFGDLELAILLPGEIRSFAYVKPALEAGRAELEAFLDRGGYLIAIGTSGLLFGKSILREDGTTVEGLGLLDLTAKERQYVWGDDLHFRLNETKMEILGSQFQMADAATQLIVNAAAVNQATKREVSIDVVVSAFPDNVLVSLRDNGVPFDPTAASGDVGERSPDASSAPEIDSVAALRAVASSLDYSYTLGMNHTIIEVKRREAQP